MWYNGVRGPTTPSHANNVRHRLPWVVWPRFESMVLRVSIRMISILIWSRMYMFYFTEQSFLLTFFHSPRLCARFITHLFACPETQRQSGIAGGKPAFCLR